MEQKYSQITNNCLSKGRDSSDNNRFPYSDILLSGNSPGSYQGLMWSLLLLLGLLPSWTKKLVQMKWKRTFLFYVNNLLLACMVLIIVLHYTLLVSPFLTHICIIFIFLLLISSDAFVLDELMFVGQLKLPLIPGEIICTLGDEYTVHGLLRALTSARSSGR